MYTVWRTRKLIPSQENSIQKLDIKQEEDFSSANLEIVFVWGGSIESSLISIDVLSVDEVKRCIDEYIKQRDSNNNE